METLSASVQVIGRTLGLEMALSSLLCDLGQVTSIHLILRFLKLKSGDNDIT